MRKTLLIALSICVLLIASIIVCTATSPTTSQGAREITLISDSGNVICGDLYAALPDISGDSTTDDIEE